MFWDFVLCPFYVYVCVRCKTLCIIGGQHDGLCPFWQPARSIFTVLLCFRANKLSLWLQYNRRAVDAVDCSSVSSVAWDECVHTAVAFVSPDYIIPFRCKNWGANGELWKGCGPPSVMVTIPARDHEIEMSQAPAGPRRRADYLWTVSSAYQAMHFRWGRIHLTVAMWNFFSSC